MLIKCCFVLQFPKVLNHCLFVKARKPAPLRQWHTGCKAWYTVASVSFWDWILLPLDSIVCLCWNFCIVKGREESILFYILLFWSLSIKEVIHKRYGFNGGSTLPLNIHLWSCQDDGNLGWQMNKPGMHHSCVLTSHFNSSLHRFQIRHSLSPRSILWHKQAGILCMDWKTTSQINWDKPTLREA